MRFRKNQKGFTMVEGIVIAVIIAVISSIAIPIYRGYIDSSQQSVVDNLAETAALAANSWVRKKDEASLTLQALNLRYDATVYTIAIDKTNDEITVKGNGKTKTVKY
jgi:Tfp pilus assembly protein PilE